MATGGETKEGGPASAPPQPLRIQRIAIRAYRAFGAEQEIPVGGRNLVIYGENGSGKSSIYKALRDLFARKPVLASLKNNAHVYPLDAGLTPQVAVTFTDGGAPVQWTESQHPGRPPADARVAVAALRSSFLDYHALLETNAFHGQRRPNLFKLAVETLLADFADATSPQTIEERWDAVQKAKPWRHLNGGGHLPPVEEACEAFNAALARAIEALLPIINILLADLGRGDLLIEEFERGTVRYNDAWFRDKRGFDGRELFVRLAFRGYHPEQPQHFLNEARLSALALAFYLAGRLACVPSAPSPALKLLVLDDVLAGLDYANRRPLMSVLDKHFSDWQIVLLTHDRHWFEIIRATIPKDRWTCHEMYEMTAVTGEATPYLRPVSPDIVRATLKQAREFIKQKHLPAAANYARSACELLLREQCGKRNVPFPYKQDPKKITFEQLKNGLKSALADDQPKLNALEAITPHQSRILNPLSHDPTTSLNEAEVVAAIDEVEALMTALRATP